MGKEPPEKARYYLGHGHFEREIVLSIDGGESLVADAATDLCVFGPGPSDDDFRIWRCACHSSHCLTFCLAWPADYLLLLSVCSSHCGTCILVLWHGDRHGKPRHHRTASFQ